MWWRLPRSEYEREKGDGNRALFQRLVESREAEGMLAYVAGEPVGWCAVGPRESFPVLQRSRILKPIDDEPVWSVPCFFIDRRYRVQGLSVRLLTEAVAYARERGATVVEGYPVEPRSGAMPAAFAWTGVPAIFLRAGFEEVLRRSPTRPIMRCGVSPA
jgi:GNAT superfamily N-acetyltransferase